MSAKPEYNTNNMHIKLEEESSNPTSGLNANGYIHLNTLQSILWSSTADMLMQVTETITITIIYLNIN